MISAEVVCLSFSQTTCDSALMQIRDRMYDRELIAGGIAADNIISHGFGFDGKEVLIKKM